MDENLKLIELGMIADAVGDTEVDVVDLKIIFLIKDVHVKKSQ